MSTLPYNPQTLPRELKKYYISAEQADIDAMLKELNLNDLEQLFTHIPSNIRFDRDPELGQALEYKKLQEHIETLAAKNNNRTSFIGDGLKNFRVHEIVPYVNGIRGLLTAYTPYQPERSQGTLTSLYLYSSALSMLTGFEAINSSMHDRPTCLYEAMKTAQRLVRNSNTILVSSALYPGDLEVLNTLARNCDIDIQTIPVNPQTGLTDYQAATALTQKYQGKLAAIAFPQVNSFGNLEDVYAFSKLAHECKAQAIAIVDPILLADDGLVPPCEYQADILVGEGQHLAIGPCFGGPGLGVFGIRYNDKNKLAIRSTAGRFVGKGKDSAGNDAYTIILSTREQHIRREKATSNICSNQAFIATLAGASIIAKGEKGMRQGITLARNNALETVNELLQFTGVELAFPQTPFFNEVTLKLPCNSTQLIKSAIKHDLHLGVDVSTRLPDTHNNLLLLSFSDIQEKKDLQKLITFFASQFKKGSKAVELPPIPSQYLRKNNTGLPNFDLAQVKKFYQQLGEQNVSPDNVIYPLGSCTMKYNPYINEYAATLPGFFNCHPQAPIEDCQGSLELLYHTQELFKKMTGLSAVTTQPVAGAQGELTGLKMFQAYHQSKGEGENRNIILIPHSAHGTNPATATMAGYETKVVNGQQIGLVLIEATPDGEMDFAQIEQLVQKYSTRIAGIMVTNPNTSGIFERRYKEIAELIHKVGGLVYMDGANMNAICGYVNLAKMGVDAVHNNLHKTWAVPHGGGGPGAAIVAVSDKLVDFLPGPQVILENGLFSVKKTAQSIGSMQRHFGNFGATIRSYTYLKALGTEGVKKIAAVADLSSRYLFTKLKKYYPTLPQGADNSVRMHEFILTISEETFKRLQDAGTPKANAIARIGKLFLDFGLHAPTVAFPEVYGLMVEPTESFTKKELDRFAEAVVAMHNIMQEHPAVLTTVPHFTPVTKVDEVEANKNIILSEKISSLPPVAPNKVAVETLMDMNINQIYQKILDAHNSAAK